MRGSGISRGKTTIHSPRAMIAEIARKNVRINICELKWAALGGSGRTESFRDDWIAK
jgi:hypothetical protein